MKTYVAAKIHGIRVTDKSVEYHGSVAICPELMAASGIEPYEQVHVINLTNGERWVTYAIESDTGGEFSLRGGGARLGEIGDSCVIITYRHESSFSGAKVIHVDERNVIREVMNYDRA
jgi:aspartate 1-decarboxylase